MDSSDAERIKVYFDAVAPAFANDARYQVFLEIAEDRCDRGYFGDSWTKAMAYLTAHLMEMSSRNGSESGPVTSRREGDISVTFAAGEQNDSDLYMTTFGKMYIALLNGRSQGVILSGGCHYGMMSWGNC